MSKYLVIVEAPGKLAKFSKLLGKDYHVIASAGHIMDLPATGKNVKIQKDKNTNTYIFTPNYDVLPGKEKIVENIQKEASKKYEKIFLMTDPDREGESISWFISKHFPPGAPLLRATTTSLTQEAVDSAIKNAGSLDLKMVDSFETRRILDRLTGYECSFLTKMATGGRSVGRVQSAALRLLEEREQEIKKFKPEEYWDIRAELLDDNKNKILAKVTEPDERDVKNKEQADVIVDYLKLNKKTSVSKYETKQIETMAYAPFTTSTLQQTASSYFGWPSKKTMMVAQKLYEAGDITYSRTDSVSLAPAFVLSCRNYIQNSFDAKYLPENSNFFKTNSKNAQEAHEACRVSDVNKLYAGNTDDERKLYKLIWKRSVACQMAKSVHLSISAKFASGKYELSANGRKQLFDGWKKIYDYSQSEDVLLPEMKVGDILNILDVTAEQKFTQPPSRYTEGSFVKLMETNGIGRPSTFTATLETLKSREYILVEKKSIVVTDLGIKVIEFLKKSDFCFIDVAFTSKMEEDLDLIAEDKAKKTDVLNHFYTRLKSDIEKAAKIKQSNQTTDIPCPKCGLMLLKKYSKFGPFFACSERKTCGFKANSDKEGNPILTPPPPKEIIYGAFPCQTCGAKMILREGKYGKFLGCSLFPQCRSLRKEDGTPIENKGSFKKKWPSKKAKKDPPAES